MIKLSEAKSRTLEVFFMPWCILKKGHALATFVFWHETWRNAKKWQERNKKF